MDEIVSKAIARQLGFEKYIRIMELYEKGDFRAEFQGLFDGYYKVRRDGDWRAKYYKCFKELKEQSDKNITYGSILNQLANSLPKTKKGNTPVEASFASKMLATINPEMPILDSQVMENMGLSLGTSSKVDKRLRQAVEVYNEIESRYKNYRDTPQCNQAVSLFDDCFPEYKKCFNITKKIDWFLWGFKKEELESMGLFAVLLSGVQNE